MHFATILSIASLAAASPITRDTPTSTPPTSKSQGFQLVVNVTDLSRDFAPSIHQKYINSIHVGAGQSLLGVGSKQDSPRTFYINGTALDFHFANSTVVSDAGTPLTPWGISLTKDKGSDIASTAHLNGGPGAKGIGLTRWSVPYTFMYPETYAICNESLAYYGGKKFLIVKQFNLGIKGLDAIPKTCVPVRLFAQCAKLNDLPKGSISSHKFAYETECYEDVAGIDWPKYRPW
ncbi:hypothetical protein VFPPC_16499 [Pochonia chlamydosporia 170]|uniref:DUF7907 domain-containing protein n=1 Tax=Pochonia chlamydosporia 170 TaxID=1380566 RepID=A0A179FEH9_METCM|nr:hypothetical protein VFPPC_16499 [Pochonia chlamydosporia 170]OAQ63651.1 hypothetical protein VFPPC_16499 [Pochonia chlamydosporia 170]